MFTHGSVRGSIPSQPWKAPPTCPRSFPVCLAVEVTCHRIERAGSDEIQKAVGQAGKALHIAEFESARVRRVCL